MDREDNYDLEDSQDDEIDDSSEIDESYKQELDEKDNIRIISAEIKEYLTYLQTIAGGGLSKATAETALSRIAKFVLIAFEQIYTDDREELSETNIVLFIRDVVFLDHSLIAAFSNFLTNVSVFKSTTVISHLEGLNQFSKWFCYFRQLSPNESVKMETSILTAWNITIKHIRKNYRKISRRENGKKTIETLILDNRIPRGGLEDLRKIVVSRLKWAGGLNAQSFQNKATYNDFSGLMYSCFFTSAVQGRYVIYA